MKRLFLTILIPLGAAISGCGGSSRHQIDGVSAYYRHLYPASRDALRPLAADRSSEDVVLNNLRLGMACLADGDYDEAERSLLRAYEYLTSGQVNAADRTIGSVVLHEGVTVWKGEPYEQAMGFYYVSALYMLKGDWENARAAAANSLFALRDFGDSEGNPRGMDDLVRDAAAAERQGRGDYLSNGYKVIESQFTLGFLMAAIAHSLMNQPADATRLFDHVRQLRPELAPLTQELAARQYDTLLLVDAGSGPRKQSYGPDQALIKFVPDGRYSPPMRVDVRIDGKIGVTSGRLPLVDLWTLSQYPKWWSMEGIRKAKSTVGNVLLFGGVGAAVIGSQAHSREAALAGLGAAAVGALLKAGSEADTRHLETLPRSTFVIPLTLGSGAHDITLQFTGESGAIATWNDLTPGTPGTPGSPGKPSVYYLRMHNAHGLGMPTWPPQRLRSVAADQIKPDDKPWIMGGNDLTPPSQSLIDTYHSRAILRDMTLGQLIDLYRGEGFVFTPGPQGRADDPKLDPRLFHHIVDGGKALFSPHPGTFQYQRITRNPIAPYQPAGEPLRRAIRIETQPTGGKP